MTNVDRSSGHHRSGGKKLLSDPEPYDLPVEYDQGSCGEQTGPETVPAQAEIGVLQATGILEGMNGRGLGQDRLVDGDQSRFDTPERHGAEIETRHVRRRRQLVQDQRVHGLAEHPCEVPHQHPTSERGQLPGQRPMELMAPKGQGRDQPPREDRRGDEPRHRGGHGRDHDPQHARTHAEHQDKQDRDADDLPRQNRGVQQGDLLANVKADLKRGQGGRDGERQHRQKRHETRIPHARGRDRQNPVDVPGENAAGCQDEHAQGQMQGEHGGDDPGHPSLITLGVGHQRVPSEAGGQDHRQERQERRNRGDHRIESEFLLADSVQQVAVQPDQHAQVGDIQGDARQRIREDQALADLDSICHRCAWTPSPSAVLVAVVQLLSHRDSGVPC